MSPSGQPVPCVASHRWQLMADSCRIVPGTADPTWHRVDSEQCSVRQVFAAIDCNYDKGQLSSVGAHRPPLPTLPPSTEPLRSRKLWQDYNQGRFPCRVPIITILPDTLQEGALKDGNPTQLREPVVTSLDCCVLLRGLPSLSQYLAAAPASDLILERLPTNQRPSSLSGREPSIGSNTRSTSACFCSHPKSIKYLT